MIIHFIRFSQKRMIASGIDRLSRGVCNDGFMGEDRILIFLSFLLSVGDRSLELILGIRSWWNKDEDLDHYSPNDWYSKVISRGNFIWTSP